ncbi:MAG: hypothetical protein OXF03_04020 [Gammaproteobacteria bacterium]|nr:hypothetical protein [Gammaproteobacteria bacterium]MCY4341939.1 hypothetical protein [Gammaproteobacteria bacterium]
MLGQNKILVWRGRYSAAMIVLLAAMLAGGGGAGWWLQGERLNGKIAGMQARIENLELRNLELSRMIDEEAMAALRSQVRNLQGQVMNQRMTIQGLQEIITPQEARAGLRIHSVNVEPGDEAQDYRLSLGLTQALLARSQRARGHVELLLAGTMDGGGAELPLEEVSKRGTSRIEFNFASSTVLRADMTLPSRFEPSTITVRVTPDPDEEHQFERQFPWVLRQPKT